MRAKLHCREGRTFLEYSITSSLSSSSQAQTLSLTHPHRQLMFLLNYDRSKNGCRGRKRNNKRRKKQTTKKLNQPTPRHNNKYKNTSWQNQAFHCRPRSLGRTPADHQQRRPAPLLTEVCPSLSRLPPAPTCLQAGSREHRGRGRQQQVGGCFLQHRWHT